MRVLNVAEVNYVAVSVWSVWDDVGGLVLGQFRSALSTASIKSSVNVRTKIRNVRLPLELWPIIELENLSIANALQLEVA